MMGATNITLRVDEDIKRQFDAFCESVGMNVTTAINMFMRAVLRTRELPFVVTDAVTDKDVLFQAKAALKAMQEQSVINGNSEMTLDEINAEIALARKEMRERMAAQENASC